MRFLTIPDGTRDCVLGKVASAEREPVRADIHMHRTAEVSPSAEIGADSQIRHHAQVREGARLGNHCFVGKGAYIDTSFQIGSCVKIRNYALIYQGATLEVGVSLGPHACPTNDIVPRAITPEGALKGADDWLVGRTVVRYGATVGAHATVLPGVAVGSFALVGAGSVVKRNVPDFGLVVGQPARLAGYVCRCGHKLTPAD